MEYINKHSHIIVKLGLAVKVVKKENIYIFDTFFLVFLVDVLRFRRKILIPATVCYTNYLVIT